MSDKCDICLNGFRSQLNVVCLTAMFWGGATLTGDK